MQPNHPLLCGIASEVVNVCIQLLLSHSHVLLFSPPPLLSAKYFIPLIVFSLHFHSPFLSPRQRRFVYVQVQCRRKPYKELEGSHERTRSQRMTDDACIPSRYSIFFFHNLFPLTAFSLLCCILVILLSTSHYLSNTVFTGHRSPLYHRLLDFKTPGTALGSGDGWPWSSCRNAVLEDLVSLIRVTA
jgi:hypothetical protein